MSGSVVDDRPWTVTVGGLTLALRLTPKGGRDAIDGVERQANGRTVLKARVRTVASDGAANAAVVRLVAATFRVAPSRVTLTAGATSRTKRITVAGDPAALLARITEVCTEVCQ